MITSLPAALATALADRGYDKLTPVQEAVTDPDLSASDLLVSAQTGSGKTVGFGLAVAPTLLAGADSFGPAATPLALIVAPTRELAFQVMQELRWLYARTGAVVTSCVGGMDMRDERRALDRGAHIVVGTPGRLSDHLRRQSLDLGDVRAVVLDEADEMLDLGFREDLEFILASAPEDRRTLLFSATVPATIAKLAQEFQRDARRISTIDSKAQHADITYQALRVAPQDGDSAIFNLLRYHDDESAIVFANTRAAVNHLSARLTNRGLSVVTLSGELSQSERSHALQAMRDGRARVCVATDVAARGIDLPNLALVIHADLPMNTESLLHRSGRTGRAGRKGISALIVPPKMVKRTERLLNWAKINAEWDVPPSAEAIAARDEERLLNDPAWREPIPEAQAEFAAKLLSRHGAEAVAAAFLRLRAARHAAPEELLPPDTKPTRERTEFGPSRWFSLSIGRDDRAEPRWLLPLLLRNADLEKANIGAIRVQDTMTLVEISEAAAPRLMSALGPDGTLAENIRVKAVEGVPEFGPRPARPEGPRPPRDRDAAPRKPRPAREQAAPAHSPAPEAPARPAPRPAPRPADEARTEERPSKPRPKYAANPSQRLDDKPRGKPGAKPGGKFAGKPGGKPDGKPSGKPFKGKDGGKPGGKDFGKPGGKPFKPKGKPHRGKG